MRSDNINKLFQEMGNVTLNRCINYVLIASVVIFAFIYYPLWFTHDVLLTHDALMWFGAYHYIADCLASGYLPLWDPYGQSGNSFYQNVNFLGLLEPISIFYFVWVKLTATSILHSFIYLHITRIIFMSIGAYMAYQFLSGSKLSARIAAVVFFMSLFSSSLHQNGFVNLFMTLPWILYFSLRYLDNIGKDGSARYLYSASIALGIAFNMYIPVYTVFYLLIFYMASILTGAIRLSHFKLFYSRIILKECSIALALLLLLSAIPLSIFINDLGQNGELYPYLRSYTSGNSILEKKMVSDTSETALSSKNYYNGQVSGAFLNLVQLVAPSYWKVKWNLMLHKYFQETFQFIGIVSILIIICTIRFKSRFKYGAILTTVIISLVMTATQTTNISNYWHTLFKIIFPPLQLIKVFESFLGGHLFNLGLLLAMGLSFLEKESIAETVYGKKLYIQYFILFCLFIYLISFMFIFKKIIDPRNLELYLANFKLSLWIHVQSVLYLIIIICTVYVVIVTYKCKYISYRFVYLFLSFIILSELILYNLPSGLSKVTLSPNYLKTDDPVVHQPKPDIYQNFRNIYVPGYFRFVTFQEALMKKDAVFPDIFHMMGNVVFTSKRYYELITHIPTDNIFAIAGVTSPKARFFEKAYISDNRNDIVEKLSKVSANRLNDSLLLVETDNPMEFSQFKVDINSNDFSTSNSTPLEIKGAGELIKKVFPTIKAFSERHFMTAKKDEAREYAFPKDWLLYILQDVDGIPIFPERLPNNLLTMDNSNVGKIIILKESQPAVLLNGVSKRLNPVFLDSRRSYGEMTYTAEAGPPLGVFTLADGKIISTKPFDGYLLFDTLARKANDTDKGIKNTHFSSNKVSFSIKNQNPGFFYYADGWSPYWTAYDNDKPTKVLKANYNYKAVFLSPGDHIVTFVFKPLEYIFALFCYFAGLLIGLSYICIILVRDRKR